MNVVCKTSRFKILISFQFSSSGGGVSHLKHFHMMICKYGKIQFLYGEMISIDLHWRRTASPSFRLSTS